MHRKPLRMGLLALLGAWFIFSGRAHALKSDGLAGLTNINKIMSLVGSGTHPCKGRVFSAVFENSIKLEEMKNFKMSVVGDRFKATFSVDGYDIKVSGLIKYINPPSSMRVKLKEARTDGFFSVDVKERLVDALTEVERKGLKVKGDIITVEL